MDGLQLAQGYRANTRRHFTSYFRTPGLPGTYLVNFGWMKDCVDLGATKRFWTRGSGLGIQQLNHSAIARLEFPVSFLYISKHCSISVIYSQSNRFIFAQSIFHSRNYTKYHSPFQIIKPNKSLLLVKNNCGFLINFSRKKSSQVVRFNSTSISQRLYFYFVLECLAIYFQCYAFHRASI